MTRGGVRAAATALAAAALAAGCARDGGAEALPRIAQVPDQALLKADGAPFRASDLRGEVWVASFVFTSCRTVCPSLTAQMRNLGTRHARRGLKLVSFSVDPTTDTPERLRAYAARFDADPAVWTFVTGDAATMREVVVGGFKLHYGEPEPLAGADDPDAYDILHSTYFALVDREGYVRGYYRNDAESLARLDRDLVRLLAAPAGPPARS